MQVELIFLSLITLAACSDTLTRKVPNPLNFTLILSGLGVAIIGAGHVDWFDALLGLLTALGVLFIPFALRVYQGGDVKLCMGIGAWLGVRGVLWTIALGVVGGGLFALIVHLWAYRSRQSSKAITIPMAVSFAIAGGTVYRLGAPPW